MQSDTLNRRPGSLSVHFEVKDASGVILDTFADTFKNEAGQVYKRRAD